MAKNKRKGSGSGIEEWMHNPRRDSHCPKGLENLLTVDQFLVQREKSCDNSTHKYTVKNVFAQKMYSAVEESGSFGRAICGPRRSYCMRIFDNHETEVMLLKRRCACECCCFPCCLQSVKVSTPMGDFFGSVKQKCSICYLSYKVRNNKNQTVLRIIGPCCTWGMASHEIEFKVLSMTGEQVGKISKHCTGIARDFFVGTDFFGITFSKDLDVRTKSVLLGATFLIGIMFLDE